jgi:hypothetical protein
MPLKLGEPFGVDQSVLDRFDWDQAVRRILNDTQSDFIFAPHLRFIYRHNADGLIKKLKNRLSSGNYVPASPLTIEVPKSSRIYVRASPPRPGPNYSRPGSILLPEDRLFYQFLADNCVDLIEKRTDKSRSFSHRISTAEPDKLFEQTRTCWSSFQSAMKKYASRRKVKYVLKVDVANFFGSINLHTLVNSLSDLGLSNSLAERLESVLTSFTNSRSSRGIVQGIFPSDLLGNFYLEPVDRFLADRNIPSARYVDDIYVFLESVGSADSLIKALIPKLRQLDLALNEAKSSLFPKSQLVVEEPDLEELFQEAIQEVQEQLADRDFEVSYGFQSDWGAGEDDDNDTENVDIELAATTNLFDAIGSFRGHEEEIERFCLPLFMKAGSDYAVDHVITSFEKRPAMCQIYCSYLGKFCEDKHVHKFLAAQLKNENLYDWQLMWVIGALLQRRQNDDMIVRDVYQVFKSGRHDAVRAVAAIFVGSNGDQARRNDLAADCPNAPEYVQSAIYYVSRRWKGASAGNMHAQWGNRSDLNKLISSGWNSYKGK